MGGIPTRKKQQRILASVPWWENSFWGGWEDLNIQLSLFSHPFRQRMQAVTWGMLAVHDSPPSQPLPTGTPTCPSISSASTSLATAIHHWEKH